MLKPNLSFMFVLQTLFHNDDPVALSYCRGEEWNAAEWNCSL